jgi:adenine-specific DNA-methyltransferase
MEQDNFNAMQNVQSFDWNNERLQQLKNLMPDLFTNDGQLNINELKKVINPNLITETERYEFTWFGKSNAKREAFTPTNATLVYDEDRSINPTQSENLIIEGENLAVLKLLSNSYREQIKCIYIDPPYNTGKDFVYSDKFNQDKKEYWEDAEITENGIKVDTNSEADGRFHSNWLNMMYSRLLISRQLLKEDGVIFISIDDNEVHHLRKLCDEVFGEENFVSEIIWQKGAGTQNDNKYIATNHEYILAYCKSKENTIFYNLPPSKEMLRNYNLSDEFENERGKYTLRNLNDFSIGDRPGLHYDIECPDGSILEGKKHRWRCDIHRYKWRTENKRIVFEKDKNDKWNVFYKQYLFEKKEEVIRDENGNILSYGKIPNSLLSNFVFTGQGKKDIEDLFGDKKPFDYPKPFVLVQHLITIITKNNDLILDFFAGSGTTAQAVMELNKEDGGNRKFILVQIPETTDGKSEAYKAGYKKISDITIERIKRVIDKIQKEQSETLKKQKQELQFEPQNQTFSTDNLGFKVFKLQKSNFPRVEFAPNPDASEEENIEALKKYIRDKESQMVNSYNREEIITEILIKNGFKLNYTLTPQTQFTKNEILLATDGEKETLICIDTSLHEITVEYFKTNTKQKLIVLERALNTTQKWNLKHHLNDKFIAF